MKKKFIACLILLSLAFSVNAQNEKSKKSEVSKKVTDVSRGARLNTIKKKEIAIPEVKLGFETKKHTLNDVKPPKNLEVFVSENKDQVAYEKALDSQIAELFRLTQKFKTSENRGELWLRLSELYTEKANLVNDRVQTDFDKKLEEYQSGKLAQLPTLDLSKVRVFNNKSIQLYEWFLRDFPKDAKVDQALFYLAYEKFEVGDVKEGVQYYDRLVTKFPESRFAKEAHFALGEYWFDTEKWTEALKHYEPLLQDEKHPLQIIAVYRTAWALFRTGKINEGLKYLDMVVKSSSDVQTSKTSTGKKVDNLRLENEVAGDLVIFYAETDDMDAAIDYLKKNRKNDWKLNTVRLANRLSAKGYFENARKVYKYLISLDPMAKESFDYQYKIVQDYYFSKQTAQFKQELYLWINTYGVQSDWYRFHSEEPLFIEKVNPLLELTLRNYILQQHQTAQNSRAQTPQQEAKTGYEYYLKSFTKADAADEMRFFYAELLFDMGLYAEAAEQYEIVATQQKSNKHSENASKNWMISLEKIIPKDEDFQKSTENTIEPIPLDKHTSKLITASNWNIQNYPKNEKTPEIKFRVGRIYYLTNNFAPAELYFKEIVQAYPKTKVSEYSANLLLDIYNLKKDYVGLEKMGNELLTDQAINNTKLGDDIRGVVEKAGFVKAQELEKKSNFLGAAEQYGKFAEQNPKSKLLASAYFNAGVNFEKAAQFGSAILAYKKVLGVESEESKSLRLQVKKLLAKIYQDSGYLENAAQMYGELAAEAPAGEELTLRYQYNMAYIHELLGKGEWAESEYMTYFNNVNQNGIANKDIERAETMYRIAEMMREMNLKEKAVLYYGKYLRLKAAQPDIKVEALFWIYKLQFVKYDEAAYKAAESDLAQMIATTKGDKKTKSVEYMARLKLIQAADIFEKLNQLQIPEEASKQKAAVNQKLEMMTLLNAKLSAVIKINSGAEIVEAMNLLALANENMAATFRNAPLPKDLDEESKTLYKAEVERIAAPFATKAIDSYRLACEQGRKQSVYSASYEHACVKISQKFPNEFYMPSETYRETRNIAWMLPPVAAGVSDAKKSELEQAIEAKDDTKIAKFSSETLEWHPKDVLALNAQAMVFYKRNLPKAAKEMLKRLLVVNPKSSDAFNNLALIDLQQNKQREAIANFQKALEYNTNNMTAALNLTSIYTKHHDFKKVVAVLEPMMKANSLPEDGLNYYAIALTANAQNKEAAAQYEKMLQLNPTSEPGLLNYSILSIVRLGKYSQGLDLLKRYKSNYGKDDTKVLAERLEIAAQEGMKASKTP